MGRLVLLGWEGVFADCEPRLRAMLWTCGFGSGAGKGIPKQKQTRWTLYLCEKQYKNVEAYVDVGPFRMSNLCRPHMSTATEIQLKNAGFKSTINIYVFGRFVIDLFYNSCSPTALWGIHQGKSLGKVTITWFRTLKWWGVVEGWKDADVANSSSR